MPLTFFTNFFDEKLKCHASLAVVVGVDDDVAAVVVVAAAAAVFGVDVVARIDNKLE